MPGVLDASYISQIRAGRADIAEAHIKNLRHPPVVELLTEHIGDTTLHGGTAQSGPTFPSDPFVGQCFYHTILDTLFVYKERWRALVSYGTVNLYVDIVSGSDSNTGFSGSPVKTIQAAVDRVAPINYGDVYINITRGGAGYDAPTISNLSFPAGMGLYIRGTSSSWSQYKSMWTATGGGFQGSSGTQGYVARTVSTWGVNELRNMWIRFEDNTTTAALRGVWRLIDSNTETTITIVGTFPAAPVSSDTFRVFTPGVVMDGTPHGISAYNCGHVVFQYLQCRHGCAIGPFADITLQYCRLSNPPSYPSTPDTSLYGASTLVFEGVYCQHRLVITGAYFKCYRSKFTGAERAFVYGLQQAMVEFGGGSITDGTGGPSAHGIRVARNATVFCVNDSQQGYPRFRNHYSSALFASEGAQILGTAVNQYSGNAVNETAVAASYGYID